MLGRNEGSLQNHDDIIPVLNHQILDLRVGNPLIQSLFKTALKSKAWQQKVHFGDTTTTHLKLHTLVNNLKPK
jgi:hypothetical protein